MVAFIIAHWAEIALGIMVVDKIVAKTPTKWDDLIFTAIKEAISTVMPKKK